MPDRTPWTRRAALAVAAFALLTGLAAWLASGHMPGTLRFDKTGAAHGSGWKIDRYPGGGGFLLRCVGKRGPPDAASTGRNASVNAPGY